MAEAATCYQAPFVSGKDSFYNYFITDEGPVSIPVTLLVSGIGIVEDKAHITGSSIRRTGSKLCLMGPTTAGLRGSVFARHVSGAGLDGPPSWQEADCWKRYEAYHALRAQGAVLSCHDLSEGGLAVALAEMGFSGKAGLRVELEHVPAEADCSVSEILFGETPGRLLLEVAPEHLNAARAAGAVVIGETTAEKYLNITQRGSTLIDAALSDLKAPWKQGLAAHYGQ